MKVTVKDIMLKRPCSDWPEEKVKEFIGKGKTLLQILSLDEIKAQDRVWCVTRFLDDKTNRSFAIWCARRCKTDVKEIIEYIDIIEKYYAGEATKEELQASNRAAHRATHRAADRAADRAAYWAADRAADRASDRAAYWAADKAADWAAYWAADRAADRASDRENQIKRLKQVIE